MPLPFTPVAPGTTDDLDDRFGPSRARLDLVRRDIDRLAPSAPDTPITESIKEHDRSGIAKWAVYGSMGGGVLNNGIDVARLVKKYPEALRAGRFDPSLGRFGRIDAAIGQTITMAPNRNIINPLAPRTPSVASLGRSFTKVDELAMKTSTMLGSSLAGLQFASSIPNLIDAASAEGPWNENLYDNASGRSGVLSFAGGGLGLAMLGTALVQTNPKLASARAERYASGTPAPTLRERTQQVRGALTREQLAQRTSSAAARVRDIDVRAAVRPTQVRSSMGGAVGRIIAAGKAPVMANPVLKYVGIASGFAVMANELGYYKALDRGNVKSVGTTLQEAARGTVVLNDEQLRSAAFGAGVGLAGWKVAQAVMKDGGMRNIGKGHVAGVAVSAGLLGANLLGKLGGLDAR